MEAPLFSLLILAHKERHLIASTLDSLKNQNGSFEVIILGRGYFGDLPTRYPRLVIRIEDPSTENLSETMNFGVQSARGKYLQFLEPGDRYLSEHGIVYLGELIHQNKEPQLLYSKATLIRGSNGIPRTVHLDLKTLKKGTLASSPWFLKQAVIDVGGFDPRIQIRPTLDLLCRLLCKKVQVISSPRVLTDLGPHPIGAFGYVRETCRILYRYFGLLSAIKWMFVQDHSYTLEKTAKFLKKAFWQENS